MQEQLISFEVAKLAKEKGFLSMQLNYALANEGDVKFPTQSLLQKWLREKHSIFIWSIINITTKKFGWEIWDNKNENIISCKSNSDDWNFETYEEALEEGLKEGLMLIKK